MLYKVKVKSESLMAKVEVFTVAFEMYLQTCCHTGPQSKVSKRCTSPGLYTGKGRKPSKH